MVDYDDLRESIKQGEKDGCLAILEETETDITTDDFDEDRTINYHLCPPTEEWLKERFLWTHGCEKDKAYWEDVILKCLMHRNMPPEMFITLNRIIAVRTPDDVSEVCSKLDVEECEFPSCIDVEDGGCVGCKWHTESSIILDFHAMDSCLQELQKEVGATDFWDSHAGVILTVIHELRHLMLDGSPYDILTPAPLPDDFTEEGVERWARDMYDSIYHS